MLHIFLFPISSPNPSCPWLRFNYEWDNNNNNNNSYPLHCNSKYALTEHNQIISIIIMNHLYFIFFLNFCQ